MLQLKGSGKIKTLAYFVDKFYVILFSTTKDISGMKKRIFITLSVAVGLTIISIFVLRNRSVLLFVSIFILSFLLLYKLTNYIADFKTIQNQSRIDIVFLLIFCILLCIPTVHISKAKKSRSENRYLAQKVSFMEHSKINLNYGNEFNEWFSDRFFLRNEAIKANMMLACILNHNNCKLGEVTFDKKHNLLYREFNFWGMKPIITEKENVLKTYADNMNRLQSYCNKNNMGLYVLIIPRQADYFDFKMPDKRKYMENPADEVIDYIDANTDIKVIYPKEEMAEANKISPVYFKTDHHWTKKGAYTGYSVLIKEIRKNYPNVKPLDENKLEKYYDKRVSEWWDKDMNPGQTFKQMKLPKFFAKKILDTPYIYYKNPEFKYLERINSEFLESPHDVHFRYPKGAKEKIFVVGDSFGCNFFEFMPYSFNESLYIYDNPRGFVFENYKPIIEEYKPDIMVLLFYTPNLPRFLDLYPNKYSNISKTG